MQAGEREVHARLSTFRDSSKQRGNDHGELCEVPLSGNTPLRRGNLEGPHRRVHGEPLHMDLPSSHPGDGFGFSDRTSRAGEHRCRRPGDFAALL